MTSSTHKSPPSTSQLKDIFQQGTYSTTTTPHKKRKPQIFSNNNTTPDTFVIQSYSQLLNYTSSLQEEQQESNRKNRSTATSLQPISLSLYSFTFTNSRWSKFLTILRFQQLQFTNSLVFLDLACCNLSNLHLEQLFFHVEFVRLKVLILSGNLVTALPFQTDASQLEHHVHDSPSAARIALYKSKGILSSAPNLASLILRNNLISEMSGFVRQLCLHKHLSELDLSCNAKVDVGQLCYALTLSKTIQKLNLSALGLHTEEMSSLMDVILFTKLTHLNLWCNQLDEQFAKMLRDYIMMHAQEEDTEGQKSLNPATTLLATQLEHLNLGMNQLTNTGAVYMSDLLREHLVEANGISHTSDPSNVENNNNYIHLKSLDLSSNRISSKGAQALSSALMLNSHLQSLNLSDNQLNAQDCEILIKSVQNHQGLQFVNLSRNLYSEQEMRHLGSVAEKFASHIHFKFQHQISRNEELNQYETLVNHVDKEINPKFHPSMKSNGAEASGRIGDDSPTPKQKRPHQDANRKMLPSGAHMNAANSHTVNHSLMDTISNELKQKSTIPSPVGIIPVNQNTFDDTQDEEVIQPQSRPAVPEPDVEMQLHERLTSGKHRNHKKEEASSGQRNQVFDAHDSHAHETLNSSHQISHSTHLPHQDKSTTSRKRGSPLSPEQLEHHRTRRSSPPRSDLSASSSQDPSELNTFLNEIFQLKKAADTSPTTKNDHSASTVLSSDKPASAQPTVAEKENPTTLDSNLRDSSAIDTSGSLMARSFSKRRSQFFETSERSLLEDDDAEQENQQSETPMSFLGMLKKRGLISNEKDQENEQQNQPTSSSEHIDEFEAKFMQLAMNAEERVPHETEIHSAPAQQSAHIGNDAHISSHLDQADTTDASAQPPASLIELLKRDRSSEDLENNPSEKNQDSERKRADSGAMSPLVVYGGKRNPETTPSPHFHQENESPHDAGDSSPLSISTTPQQVSGDVDSFATGTPITPLTPTGAGEDIIGQSALISPSSRFKSAVHAVIATAKIQKLSFRAKSLSSKEYKTKKKVDVEITEEGALLVSHQPSSLLRKSKSKTLYSVPIEENLQTKILKGGKVKVKGSGTRTFTLTMSTKEQTQFTTAITTIQRRLEKERLDKEEAQKRLSTGSEKKLMLDPFSEYVRGVRPFQSEGDNRINVQVDELYKLEARVNGWYFVSRVSNPQERGYLLPEDVTMENTSQYHLSL